MAYRFLIKSISKNLLLIAISVFISLLVIEFILWNVLPPIKVGVGTTATPKAKIYGWAPPPRSRIQFINPDTDEIINFYTNSQGWKDVEHSFEKPEGVVRILFLGDSITWGFVAIDDLYTRKVELLFKRLGFDNIEVITIGVGGWSTDQALEALSREGIKYQPDIVIYQFCANDIEEILFPYEKGISTKLHNNKVFKYKMIDGKLEKINLYPKTKKVSETSKIRSFFNKSALVWHAIRLKNRLMISLQRVDEEKVKGFSKEEMAKIKFQWGPFLMNPQGVYRHSSFNHSKESLSAWDLFEVLSIKMKQISEKIDADFLIFSESGENGLRIFSERWNLIEQVGGVDRSVWKGQEYLIDLKRPLRDLKEVCERNKISLIEPRRQYQRYNFDPHPNKVGNASMAEDIVDFLLNWEPFLRKIR
ncbi:MAG: SGNH/GDSL hydrolase family protein [Candidatus Omnitrophota bacterium]